MGRIILYSVVVLVHHLIQPGLTIKCFSCDPGECQDSEGHVETCSNNDDVCAIWLNTVAQEQGSTEVNGVHAKRCIPKLDSDDPCFIHGPHVVCQCATDECNKNSLGEPSSEVIGSSTAKRELSTDGTSNSDSVEKEKKEVSRDVQSTTDNWVQVVTRAHGSLESGIWHPSHTHHSDHGSHKNASHSRDTSVGSMSYESDRSYTYEVILPEKSTSKTLVNPHLALYESGSGSESGESSETTAHSKLKDTATAQPAGTMVTTAADLLDDSIKVDTTKSLEADLKTTIGSRIEEAMPIISSTLSILPELKDNFVDDSKDPYLVRNDTRYSFDHKTEPIDKYVRPGGGADNDDVGFFESGEGGDNVEYEVATKEGQLSMGRNAIYGNEYLLSSKTKPVEKITPAARNRYVFQTSSKGAEHVVNVKRERIQGESDDIDEIIGPLDTIIDNIDIDITETPNEGQYRQSEISTIAPVQDSGTSDVRSTVAPISIVPMDENGVHDDFYDKIQTTEGSIHEKGIYIAHMVPTHSSNVSSGATESNNLPMNGSSILEYDEDAPTHADSITITMHKTGSSGIFKYAFHAHADKGNTNDYLDRNDGENMLDDTKHPEIIDHSEFPNYLVEAETSQASEKLPGPDMLEENNAPTSQYQKDASELDVETTDLVVSSQVLYDYGSSQKSDSSVFTSDQITNHYEIEKDGISSTVLSTERLNQTSFDIEYQDVLVHTTESSTSLIEVEDYQILYSPTERILTTKYESSGFTHATQSSTSGLLFEPSTNADTFDAVVSSTGVYDDEGSSTYGQAEGDDSISFSATTKALTTTEKDISDQSTNTDLVTFKSEITEVSTDAEGLVYESTTFLDAFFFPTDTPDIAFDRTLASNQALGDRNIQSGTEDVTQLRNSTTIRLQAEGASDYRPLQYKSVFRTNPENLSDSEYNKEIYPNRSLLLHHETNTNHPQEKGQTDLPDDINSLKEGITGSDNSGKPTTEIHSISDQYDRKYEGVYGLNSDDGFSNVSIQTSTQNIILDDVSRNADVENAMSSLTSSTAAREMVNKSNGRSLHMHAIYLDDQTDKVNITSVATSVSPFQNEARADTMPNSTVYGRYFKEQEESTIYLGSSKTIASSSTSRDSILESSSKFPSFPSKSEVETKEQDTTLRDNNSIDVSESSSANTPNLESSKTYGSKFSLDYGGPIDKTTSNVLADQQPAEAWTIKSLGTDKNTGISTNPVDIEAARSPSDQMDSTTIIARMSENAPIAVFTTQKFTEQWFLDDDFQFQDYTADTTAVAHAHPKRPRIHQSGRTLALASNQNISNDDSSGYTSQIDILSTTFPNTVSPLVSEQFKGITDMTTKPYVTLNLLRMRQSGPAFASAVNQNISNADSLVETSEIDIHSTTLANTISSIVSEQFEVAANITTEQPASLKYPLVHQSGRNFELAVNRSASNADSLTHTGEIEILSTPLANKISTLVPEEFDAVADITSETPTTLKFPVVRQNGRSFALAVNQTTSSLVDSLVETSGIEILSTTLANTNSTLVSERYEAVAGITTEPPTTIKHRRMDQSGGTFAVAFNQNASNADSLAYTSEIDILSTTLANTIPTLASEQYGRETDINTEPPATRKHPLTPQSGRTFALAFNQNASTDNYLVETSEIEIRSTTLASAHSTLVSEQHEALSDSVIVTTTPQYLNTTLAIQPVSTLVPNTTSNSPSTMLNTTSVPKLKRRRKIPVVSNTSDQIHQNISRNISVPTPLPEIEVKRYEDNESLHLQRSMKPIQEPDTFFAHSVNDTQLRQRRRRTHPPALNETQTDLKSTTEKIAETTLRRRRRRRRRTRPTVAPINMESGLNESNSSMTLVISTPSAGLESDSKVVTMRVRRRRRRTRSPDWLDISNSSKRSGRRRRRRTKRPENQDMRETTTPQLLNTASVPCANESDSNTNLSAKAQYLNKSDSRIRPKRLKPVQDQLGQQLTLILNSNRTSLGLLNKSSSNQGGANRGVPVGRYRMQATTNTPTADHPISHAPIPTVPRTLSLPTIPPTIHVAQKPIPPAATPKRYKEKAKETPKSKPSNKSAHKLTTPRNSPKKSDKKDKKKKS